ncbi:hypothetical protein HK096_006913 [Nowakowskiella sp. JEL0078]|nr:hypothetical protein HK096_006913 [Nowakowskiella sp. JEL0078]
MSTNPISVDSYGHLILLNEPYLKAIVPSNFDYTSMISSLLLYFSNEAGRDLDQNAHFYLSQQRNALRSLITVREPGNPIPINILSDLNDLLQFELMGKFIEYSDITPAIQIEHLQRKIRESRQDHHKANQAFLSAIRVWKGDITKLRIDAIVNAANSRMLGCFRPNHTCIDNAIHNAAGPQLRDDCYLIINKQGFEDPEGIAKITRAYNLPSKYVIHTVGPQIRSGQRPSPKQIRELASCYKSCLDLAKNQGLHSIAFCCISTGVFAFPQKLGARVALETVRSWLKENKYSMDIVFNVFKNEDESIYIEQLESFTGYTETFAQDITEIMNQEATEMTIESKIQCAVKWIKGADRLLIAAGAGISASAGLDYTSEEVFKKVHPAMHRRGFKRMYQFIGYTDWTPSLQWGYLLKQIDIARFNWPRTSVYQNLLQILQKFSSNQKFKSETTNQIDFQRTFIVTTNADGMFSQNGFPEDRIFTPQGDYSRIQCLKPCSGESVYSSSVYLDRVLPHIDPNTYEITNESLIPKCEKCGGPVMLNVRGGNWFLEWPYAEQKHRYLNWMNEALADKNKKTVILEIGVGFNTPSVIRWPMEKFMLKNENVKLIRVNMQYPGLDHGEADENNFIGLPIDADKAISALYSGLTADEV